MYVMMSHFDPGDKITEVLLAGVWWPFWFQRRQRLHLGQLRLLRSKSQIVLSITANTVTVWIKRQRGNVPS